ncbi:unnamed protein product [Scytosiphon promiscuus]
MQGEPETETACAAAQATSRRPRVHVVDGRAFVYDAASAAALLSDCRIWATPIGVRRARNKSPEHNFPCVLSQEQAALVLGRDLAEVTYPSSLSSPSLHGRRREDDRDSLDDSREEGERITEPRDQEGEKGAQPRKKRACSSPRPHSEWKFPETSAEKKSMAVFEDLWSKGFCAVSGSNYGADYVVYDGSPTERHSIAAVIVSRGSGDELSPAEVSGFARVQQAVGKRAVIATAPLATEEMVPVAEGEKGGGTRGVSTETASPSDHPAPAGVESKKVAPSRCQDETGTSLTAVLSSASPLAARAGVGEGAGARAGANEGVRYVTLQFHAVNSRT